MGAFEDKFGWISRLVPKGLLPEPKVAASMAAAGFVTLAAWVLQKKGYKVPRGSVEKVVTSAVGLATGGTALAGYMKASKPKAKEA
jgi:hypothetical protein